MLNRNFNDFKFQHKRNRNQIIYTSKKIQDNSEVLNLIDNNLLNGCANITGGGLADNIKRVIPDRLVADIDLNKVKTNKIFKWLKQNNIHDKEMLKTFNSGVGFCLIIKTKNLNKITKSKIFILVSNICLLI